jgi:hypothetical protein
MALAGTIKEGATTVSASGGTDVTLSTLGIQGGSNTLIFSTDTANTTRRLATASVSLSGTNINSPGGRTLQRNKIRIEFPKVLASGDVSVDFIEISAGTHPESTSAEVETRMEQAAQLLLPAKTLSFFFSGDLT